MRFRPKNLVVSAQPWWPPGHELHNPQMLSERRGNAVQPPDYRQPWDIYRFSPQMDVFFLRGENMNDQTKLLPGDWIVLDVTGKVRVYRAEDFHQIFEAE